MCWAFGGFFFRRPLALDSDDLVPTRRMPLLAATAPGLGSSGGGGGGSLSALGIGTPHAWRRRTRPTRSTRAAETEITT